MTVLKLPHLFEPREYQKEIFRAFFVDNYSHVLWIVHRRAGKSVTALNIILTAAIQKKGLYLYLLPEQAQTKKVIWLATSGDGIRFLDFIPKELIDKINNTEMCVHLVNGSIIQFTGSNRYDSLVGAGAQFIVHDEYSISDPRAREYLAPMILQNKGKELIIGTPRGSVNHMKELYDIALKKPDRWWVKKLSINDTTDNDGNPIITRQQVEDELADGKDPFLIEQEYYCDFSTPNTGSYFSKEMNNAEERGDICDFEIRKDLGAFASFDLGVRDSCAVTIWQAYGDKIHYIYAFEATDEGLPYYKQQLDEIKEKLGFRKYIYLFAPHDIMVREATSARTRLSIAREMGLHFLVVPRVTIPDKLESGRAFLPHCRFHRTNCHHLMVCLQHYRREYDPVLKVYKDKPLHDWTSNMADSFLYSAIAWRKNFNMPQLNAVRRYKLEGGSIS